MPEIRGKYPGLSALRRIQKPASGVIQVRRDLEDLSQISDSFAAGEKFQSAKLIWIDINDFLINYDMFLIGYRPRLLRVLC